MLDAGWLGVETVEGFNLSAHRVLKDGCFEKGSLLYVVVLHCVL